MKTNPLSVIRLALIGTAALIIVTQTESQAAERQRVGNRDMARERASKLRENRHIGMDRKSDADARKLTKKDMRRAGDNGIGDLVQKARESGIGNRDIDEKIRNELRNRGIEFNNGQHEGLGSFIESKLDQGLRGHELSAAIREEFGRRGLRDPYVNWRQENQQGRITQGVHSGQLTKDEFQELHTTKQGIREEEKEYKSDGTLSKDERKDLHQDLHEASKEIYEEKHDDETREGVEPAEPGEHAGINEREQIQKARITEGVATGELTKGEFHSLAQKEARLNQLEKRLKEDGTMTAEERARLQRYLTMLSSDIAREKHDEEVRK